MYPNSPPFTGFKKSVLKDMSCNHAKTKRLNRFDIRHIIVTILD